MCAHLCVVAVGLGRSTEHLVLHSRPHDSRGAGSSCGRSVRSVADTLISRFMVNG